MNPRSPFAIACLALLVATPPARAAQVPDFEHATIDDRVEIGYGVAIADIDGDRRPDIVLADKHAIVWYRNPDWRRFVMVERLTELDHVCVAARDIDGDGRAEVAAGAGWNPGDTINSGALFHLEAPEDRTARWKPVPLAHDPTIHRIRWMRTGTGGFDLVSVPLHGRGNRNGAGDGVRILAYHPPRDRKGAWTTTLLNDAWHATHNFDVVPGPGVGEELRVAAREGVFALKPAAGPGPWPITTIASAGGTSEFVGAGEVRAGRDADGRHLLATIEPMHGNQVVVYRTRNADAGAGAGAGAGSDVGAGAAWQRTVIDGTLIDGHGIVCADVLGQGRDQVIAGWRAMNAPGRKVGIRLYSLTDPARDTWETHVIDEGGMACEDLQAADLDGDGDVDLVASGRATRNLKIYWNRRLNP